MMVNKLSFFIALLCASTQANSSGAEFLSMPCNIIDSSTKTLKSGIYDKRNWMGNAKTGDSINLVFRNASDNGVAIDFEPQRLSLVKLHHIIYSENSETDGFNWIRSTDNLLKWNNIRIDRQGLTLHGIKSRNSVDLRYRSTSNWDGIVISEIIGDPDINSVQIMAINCKLSLSAWQKNFDYILIKTKAGTPSKK